MTVSASIWRGSIKLRLGVRGAQAHTSGFCVNSRQESCATPQSHLMFCARLPLLSIGDNIRTYSWGCCEKSNELKCVKYLATH